MSEAEYDVKFHIAQLEASNEELLKRLVRLTKATNNIFEACSRIAYKVSPDDQGLQTALNKAMQELT